MATGLAYSPTFLAHDTGPGHPEGPTRVEAIIRRLQADPLWDRLVRWEPEPASTETVRLVHTAEHLDFVQSFIAGGGGSIDADTHASAGSWEASLRAVGACVEAAARVADGTLANAYCVTRPPGHHATPARAMGFCLFNNVAVAAQWLIETGRARRVAILDFDVHHGNGTQDAFYQRSDVLYLSTHQYPFYPGSGHWQEQGTSEGTGYTINVPLPAGSGDAVYRAVRRRIVEPAVRHFRPDFVLVSLGFDAFWDDPLAMARLSIAGGYAPLIASSRQLADELCGGRIVVALEGGYNLAALAEGSVAVCRTLLGDSQVETDPIGPAPTQLGVETVEAILSAVVSRHGLS